MTGFWVGPSPRPSSPKGMVGGGVRLGRGEGDQNGPGWELWAEWV